MREGFTDTGVSRPISAGCVVTGRCNLRCGFCYGNFESLPTNEVSADEWRIIFGHLRSWGLMRVDLSGGEPTMRQDLAQIAQAAIEMGLNVVVSTNGLILNPTRLSTFPRVRWHVSMDSGIPEVHERSRLLPVLKPAGSAFEKTTQFILNCRDQGSRVRVLTCIGVHNRDAPFALGEHLALLGVPEWNISMVLRAGRAQCGYEDRWQTCNEGILEQLQDLESAFPFIRIRYSDRTEQNSYFLLVLPDGSLATQRTDGMDKVVLGSSLGMTLQELQHHPQFDIAEHGRKWIAARLDWQPFHPSVDPALWDARTPLSF